MTRAIARRQPLDRTALEDKLGAASRMVTLLGLASRGIEARHSGETSEGGHNLYDDAAALEEGCIAANMINGLASDAAG